MAPPSHWHHVSSLIAPVSAKKPRAHRSSRLYWTETRGYSTSQIPLYDIDEDIPNLHAISETDSTGTSPLSQRLERRRTRGAPRSASLIHADFADLTILDADYTQGTVRAIPAPASDPTSQVKARPVESPTSAMGLENHEPAAGRRRHAPLTAATLQTVTDTATVEVAQGPVINNVAPKPKRQRQLSNYQHIRKDTSRRSDPPDDLFDSDEDLGVRGDKEHDNHEEEFFDVDSGSYNGPRSTKTMSKRSFATQSLVSLDSSNIPWANA